MKKRILTQIVLVSSLLFTSNLHCQVTIGSQYSSKAGSLLDLKENDDVGVNSKRGIAFPRVKLTDKNSLYPMFEKMEGDKYVQAGNSYSKENEDELHAGLMVYNTNICTMDGSGVYLWNGKEWNRIPEIELPNSIFSNRNYFDLPSGGDIRPLVSQTLKLDWDPLRFDGQYSYTTTLGNGVSFSGTNILPSSPLSGTSSVISLLPDAMTINASSPWQSNQSQLFLKDCLGREKTVILNQTNYALKVNDVFRNSLITYIEPSNGTFSVEGNAAWKTIKSDPDNVLASTTPAIGNVNGKDLKDGTSSALSPNFSFDTNAGSRYDVADITFQDTATIKRFDDVKVSILNCNTTQNDPTMEEWAERAGFTSSQYNSLAAGETLVDGNNSPVTTANGIQLHKDQNGNIFLSGNFGQAGRWMLNNLAATEFVPTGRTGDDKIVSQSLLQNIVGENTTYKPLWVYPNNQKSLYSNNKRLGLLYNWAAATNCKGSTDYQGREVNQTGGLSSADNVLRGYKGTTDPQIHRRQGICPNGWHLPSDWEWYGLEQEFSDHTSLYSTYPDEKCDIEFSGGSNGETLGAAMKDPCLPPNTKNIGDFGGQSNIIQDSPSLRPGMFIMLTGVSGPNKYGARTFIYTSSQQSSYYGWIRLIYDRNDSGYIDNGHIAVTSNAAVRCKKD